VTTQELLTRDHFAVLGLQRTAGPADVAKAFVEAAKKWHPDRVPRELEDLRPLVGEVFVRLDPRREVMHVRD
jgi:curved DNA-binding protein CbpA